MTGSIRTSIPRIRSVRMKGGAEVRIFRGGVEIEAVKVAKKLQEAHALYQDMYRADMAGFVLIVWDSQGRNSAAHSVAATSPIGSFVLPTYAAEKIRRSLGEADAIDVVRKTLNLSPVDA